MFVDIITFVDSITFVDISPFVDSVMLVCRYDILMDPIQRQIYDAYGEKGVESGLNIGSLLKTPAEVRAEFLKQHYASQLQVGLRATLVRFSQILHPSLF